MMLAVIIQVLEHLNDFQKKIGCGSHFVFQNEVKIVRRDDFIAINIPTNLVKISL